MISSLFKIIATLILEGVIELVVEGFEVMCTCSPVHYSGSLETGSGDWRTNNIWEKLVSYHIHFFHHL